MKISNQVVDNLILRELGQRLACLRFTRKLKQSDLATQAGVSKRTVERMEAAARRSWSVWCVCAVRSGRWSISIHWFPNLSSAPVAQLKLRGKERKRAASARVSAAPPTRKWQWSDKP